MSMSDSFGVTISKNITDYYRDLTRENNEPILATLGRDLLGNAIYLSVRGFGFRPIAFALRTINALGSLARLDFNGFIRKGKLAALSLIRIPLTLAQIVICIIAAFCKIFCRRNSSFEKQFIKWLFIAHEFNYYFDLLESHIAPDSFGAVPPRPTFRTNPLQTPPRATPPELQEGEESLTPLLRR